MEIDDADVFRVSRKKDAGGSGSRAAEEKGESAAFPGGGVLHHTFVLVLKACGITRVQAEDSSNKPSLSHQWVDLRLVFGTFRVSQVLLNPPSTHWSCSCGSIKCSILVSDPRLVLPRGGVLYRSRVFV